MNKLEKFCKEYREWETEFHSAKQALESIQEKQPKDLRCMDWSNSEVLAEVCIYGDKVCVVFSNENLDIDNVKILASFLTDLTTSGMSKEFFCVRCQGYLKDKARLESYNY